MGSGCFVGFLLESVKENQLFSGDGKEETVPGLVDWFSCALYRPRRQLCFVNFAGAGAGLGVCGVRATSERRCEQAGADAQGETGRDQRHKPARQKGIIILPKRNSNGSRGGGRHGAAALMKNKNLPRDDADGTFAESIRGDGDRRRDGGEPVESVDHREDKEAGEIGDEGQNKKR